jgi:calcineurin-like phosphoesterase family protein
MNTTLVNNINSVVGQDDILFHLGDWSFGGFDKIEEFRNRITCKNIHIITGNHDHHIEKNTDGIRSIFSSVNKYLELTLDGIDYVLMHFPISSWNKLSRGSIHLHGHVHFNSIDKIGRGRCMDVGVEGNAYLPYSLNEIRSLLLNKHISSSLSNDHHNKLETHI